MPTNHKDLIAAARLPERTVELCLRGDLVAEVERLHRDLTAVEHSPAGESLDGGPATEITAQIEALRAQMQQHVLTIRMRAVSRRRWTALVKEHPPKDGEAAGVAAFDYDGLLEAAIREGTVDPQLTAADWDALLDVITDRQYDQLAEAVWGLNRGAVEVPFSPAGSRTPRRGGPGSKPPPVSGSPSNALTGGSLDAPPATTTTGEVDSSSL